VVVVNASNEDRVTAAGGHQLKLPPSLKTSGKVLRHVLTSTARQETQQAGFDATGPLRLPVPASSLVIYLASSAD
jgi:hypothetical protein